MYGTTNVHAIRTKIVTTEKRMEGGAGANEDL